MFKFGRRVLNPARPFLNFHRNYQVSVIGASYPLGQSISYLLKQHPLIHRLTMYGAPEETCGVAMDVYHVPRQAQVEGWSGRMEFALKCSEIVVVACGQPKRANQTESDQFKQNADSVIHTMQEIVAHSPKAFVVVATDPINQTVPLATKVLSAGNCYDKGKVFGVTGLDTLRAQTWVGGLYQIPPDYIKVPVVCGHSPKTAVPLFSHIVPRFGIHNSIAGMMTENIRNDDNRVAALEGGNGDPTLSSAFATFCTVSAILDALHGDAVEHVAFVANNDYGTKFYAAPVIITSHGITAMMQYKMVTPLEADYIHQSTEQLFNDVREGESYFNPDKHYQRTPNANFSLKFIKTL